MLDFDMDISHNFASFKLDNKMMFIESFDNVNFEVRVGTAEKSEFLENITAQSTTELNQKLKEAVKKI